MRFVCFAAVLLFAIPAVAVLHSGVGVIAWDFSESTYVDPMFGAWDLAMIQLAREVLDPQQHLVVAQWPGSLAVMPDTMQFDELWIAPWDRSLYADEFEFVPKRVWVVQTMEGNYAKVWFHGNMYEFDYVYQDDGTRVLDPRVPVAETTWGRIKELYR